MCITSIHIPCSNLFIKSKFKVLIVKVICELQSFFVVVYSHVVLVNCLVANCNLLISFHLKLVQPPVLARIFQCFIALDGHIVLVKLHKDITFSFQNSIKEHIKMFSHFCFFKFSNYLFEVLHDIVKDLMFLLRVLPQSFFASIIISKNFFGSL